MSSVDRNHGINLLPAGLQAKAFLPREHGGWFLFLVSLAVGLGVAEQGAIPDGSYNNARFLAGYVDWSPGISAEAQAILCDAQTSGWLLIAVPRAKEVALTERLHQAGVTRSVIGEIVPEAPRRIQVIL